jgi:hypothetical protein
MQAWAQEAPTDFLSTTLSEVNGTSLSATYGPPYQTTSQNGSTQGFGPISPQKWFGQTIPVVTFQNFVAQPLSTLPDPTGAIGKALTTWGAASAADQTTWSTNYTKALKQATFKDGTYDVPGGDYGSLGVVLENQYAYARSGGLDGALLRNETNPAIWYSNNQTFPLLYFGDSGQGGAGPDCINPAPYQQNKVAPQQKLPPGYGCWYYNQAVANVAPRYGGYLAGGTWGIVNEVGNWPGAWWLMPYSFWYQWGPGITSQSADLWAMLMTGLISLPFLFLPWIPGLRDIPKATRVYKLMWRDYYRLVRREHAGR